MPLTKQANLSIMALLQSIKADPGKRKLNLGCGQDIRPEAANWLNVDVVEGPGVEILDIYSLPWPYADNSFDYLLASHVFEHIPFHLEEYGHTRNFFIMLMEEVWRIMKPGGIVEIIVPGGIDSLAHAIDHKRIVTAKTFHVFYPDDDWSYYTKCRFELVDEIRHHPRAFKVLQRVMNRFFAINIDSLSAAVRTIVLKKSPRVE